MSRSPVLFFIVLLLVVCFVLVSLLILLVYLVLLVLSVVSIFWSFLWMESLTVVNCMIGTIAMAAV